MDKLSRNLRRKEKQQLIACGDISKIAHQNTQLFTFEYSQYMN